MLKNMQSFGESSRFQLKTSTFQNPWSEFSVRRTGHLKHGYELEDSSLETSLRAEPRLTIIGTAFTIWAGEKEMGRLTSNLSGSLWTLKGMEKEKLLEVSFKSKAGKGPETRQVEVELCGLESEKLSTKEAVWDETLGAFKLRFSLGELVSSVNNFILRKQGQDVLEFGKVAHKEYKLKAKRDIDVLSAFAVVVSALSFKWACV